MIRPRPGNVMPCHRLLLCLALGLSLMSSGCLNLDPQVDITRHFILTAQAQAHDDPIVTPHRTTIGLAPVNLPGYLQSRAMAVRYQEHEIRYLESAQWAEPLDAACLRILAKNIEALMPQARVVIGDWRRTDVTEELYVELHRFEADASGEVTLTAHWHWTGPAGLDSKPPHRRVINQSGPAPETDPAGSAAALSGALAELARVIKTAP